MYILSMVTKSNQKPTKARAAPPNSVEREKRVSVSAESAEMPFYHGGDYWNIDESIGYVIRKLKMSIERHMDSKMQAHGLTHSQWSPLVLMANGRGNTVTALAREFHLDAGAMTRMVDRLEAKGMLKRVWSAHDRRVANLELTEQGQAVTRLIPDAIAAVLNHHLRGFQHDEIVQLKANLRLMLENGRDPLPAVTPEPCAQSFSVEHG